MRPRHLLRAGIAVLVMSWFIFPDSIQSDAETATDRGRSVVLDSYRYLPATGGCDGGPGVC